MKLLAGLILFFGLNANAIYKVAIVDTGFNPFMSNKDTKNHTCKTGHYDFSTKKKGLGLDVMGHGTSVSELVVLHAKTEKFCLMHYKIFGGLATSPDDVSNAIIKAVKAGAKAINLSISINRYHPRDKKAIKYALARGVKIFNASGNSGVNLNIHCAVYPACFKLAHRDFYVVGALNLYGDIARYSNVGRIIDLYELGDYNGDRGTSFSSPRALGNYIKSLNLDRK